MIFVTGANGFIGSHIVRQLRALNLPVRALVRQSRASEKASSLRLPPGVQAIGGDVLQPQTLRDAMRGCDVVVNTVGIIKEDKYSFEQMHVESVRNMLDAMKHNNVSRLVHISALGTRENAVSEYHQTKWRAEKTIRASRMQWTIFRPSLVYGQGSEFLKQMLPLVNSPITPIISPGMDTGLLQPIHVDDVAQCVLATIVDTSDKHWSQIYEIGGPDKMTTLQILQAMNRVLDGRFRPVRVPLVLAKTMFGIGEKLSLPVPVTHGQLQMLQENTICEIAPMRMTLGVEPRAFESALREALS